MNLPQNCDKYYMRYDFYFKRDCFKAMVDYYMFRFTKMRPKSFDIRKEMPIYQKLI
jgi:hypothetical protein